MVNCIGRANMQVQFLAHLKTLFEVRTVEASEKLSATLMCPCW